MPYSWLYTLLVIYWQGTVYWQSAEDILIILNIHCFWMSCFKSTSGNFEKYKEHALPETSENTLFKERFPFQLG